MTDVYNLFKPLVTKQYSEMSLEELACEYQKSDKSSILATAYCKIFKLAIIINNEYFGLEEEDTASWCLEKLDMCLRTYKASNKFSTYFSTVYRNKLREETERLNYKKRKSILVSINEIVEEGVNDVYDLIDVLIPKDLTVNEREYCMLASEGYDNAFIAEIMHVSRMTICNIRKSLRKKCVTLQN